jgi:hypothetical protein
MTLPILLMMTPARDRADGPPPPLPSRAAMDHAATLLAHWRAHGWPVNRIGDASAESAWPVPAARPEDMRKTGGPIVLTGDVSARALIFSAEIANELGLTVYAPAETLSALGVPEDASRMAESLSARILPMAEIFKAMRNEAVSVS